MSLLNSCICVIDEFHVTAESYNQIRCNIVWRNIRALNFLAKKTGSHHVDCRWRSANNRLRSDAVKTMDGRFSV
ncbi:hypothetical protein [Bradyrhizobium icense]|uniref:hypothetical protein n=1 Tax=Bradyrhizobium icense TaxID=1274631 RepID=UPI001F1E14CC|nr:hypothetical protein [Bradyrhizobium icense]